jgi:hypothetical protein
MQKSWARFLLNPPLCSVATFEVNSEPHTGASLSVRLCVGPELARCVHRTPYFCLSLGGTVCRTAVAIGSYEGPSKMSESVEARYCVFSI